MAGELTEWQDSALSLTFTDQLIRAWLDYERANDASENTIKAYEKGLGVFVNWLKGSSLVTGTVTPQDVAQFMGDLKEQYARKPSTCV